MKKIIIGVCITLYILLALLIALTIGVIDLPDGFFYYNLGKFVLTNGYFSINPFNVMIPDISHPPLYGMFIHLTTRSFQFATTFFSFMQLLSLGLSGVFIYYTVKFLSKKLALGAMILFFIMPFLFTYATTVMAEIFTIFLLSLYLYLMVGIMTRKLKHVPPSFLVLVACILTLTKYVFMYFIPLTLIIFFFYEFYHSPHRSLLMRGLRILPIIIGFISIFWWLQFVHSYYGRYSMAVYSGRQLYGGVVYKTGLKPPLDSQAFKTYSSWTGLDYLPEGTAIDLQYGFIPAFNENKINEAEIDDIFGDMAKEALKQNPLAFIGSSFQGIYQNVVSPPYYHCIKMDLGFPDPECPRAERPICRVDWFSQLNGYYATEDAPLCQPMYRNAYMDGVWMRLLTVYTLYYPFGMILIMILMIVGNIVLFFKKPVIAFLLGIQAAALLGIHGMFAAGEGRYTMIVYPFFAIFGIFALNFFLDMIIRLKNKLLSPKPIQSH